MSQGPAPSVTLPCQACGGTFQFAAEHLGREGICPHCGNPQIVEINQPGSQQSDDAASHVLRSTRPRDFPALRLMATAYEYAAACAIVTGFVLSAVIVFAWLRFGDDQGSALSMISLIVGVAWVMYMSFVAWLTFKSAAEVIRLGIHVEHNSHQTADACRHLAEMFANRR